jgi:hypothetical protein
MKLNALAGAALAAMLIHAPARAERAPSAHIRCDGLPDNVTAGETAARLIGAVTLLGLFAPAHEAPNSSLRLAGAEGIAICNEALARESNDTRRAQLILATAIHNIEAGQYDSAIAAARLADTDRPAFAATAPYRYSLHLSAIEIEALALLGAGRTDSAVAKAMEMAEAAPYDVVTQLRAQRFVRLTARFGPAEERFYANLVRLFPAAVLDRAFARQMAGDFHGAAEDQDLWMRLERTMIGKVDMASLAQAALARALAGDAARADELAGQAREALQAEPGSAVAQSATELLDLYQIWKHAHDGRMVDARLLFASRAAWLRVPIPAVAEVARLLRAGAAPADLTGGLARDPAAYRAELLERRLHELSDAKNYYASLRGFYPQASYDRFGGNVWRSGSSRYFANADNPGLHARLINTARDGAGTPAGYALLLHSALAARAEGKSAFMIMPAQSSVATAWVRFGNPGEETMIEPMTFDTARVIADLGPLIPRPAAR